jgi:hypothetical protein
MNIDLPGDSESIIISDMMGREVFRTNADGRKQLQIDVRELQKGLYLAIAITGNGSFISGKFLKNL